MDAVLAETVNCTRYKIEGKSLYKNMTERQNCRTGNVDECSNDDLCQFATNSKWSSADKARVITWNKDARWANHLSAAKKLDLNCSVGKLIK
jgi:hypothetical protein